MIELTGYRWPHVPAADRTKLLSMGLCRAVERPARRPSLRASADSCAQPALGPRRAPRLSDCRAVRSRQGHHRVHSGNTPQSQWVVLTYELCFQAIFQCSRRDFICNNLTYTKTLTAFKQLFCLETSLSQHWTSQLKKILTNQCSCCFN